MPKDYDQFAFENFIYLNREFYASQMIVNELAKQRILAAIADRYSRRILAATMNEPVSALDLCNNCDIPVTTTYRRIEELLQAGLLAGVKYGRTADGKWYEKYRSLLKRINVTFENGDMRVEVMTNDNIADKFTRIWTSIPVVEVH